jgi:hypothetical protein
MVVSVAFARMQKAHTLNPQILTVTSITKIMPINPIPKISQNLLRIHFCGFAFKI